MTLKRLRNLLRDDTHSREIADELASHIEMRVEENLERGMSPAEARAEAERRFGNRTRLAERTREFDIPRWLDTAMQNLRYSMRALRSSRGAATLLMVSLALGIGANTAMFTLLNALLMRPLPVRDPGALQAVIMGNFSSYGWIDGDNVMNYVLWQELRREQKVFSDIFAYCPATLDISRGAEIRLINGAFATSSMWSTLALRPVLGRTIMPSDEKRGASPVAVISESFWEAEYGRNPGVLNQTVAISGRPFTIIGVAPREFFGLYVGNRADLFLPLEAYAALAAPEDPLTDGQRWWIKAVGRLRHDVTPEQARQQIGALSSVAMRRTLPANWPKDQTNTYLRQRYEVIPASVGFSDVRDGLARPLLVAFGLLGLLLLLACVNIATLQLSRGLARQREFAVRIALGASRARIGSQVFLENLLASLAGAAVGVFLAYPATEMLVGLYETGRGAVQLDLTPDVRVLAFTGVLAVVTALLFGLAPAVQAMRTNAHGPLKSARSSDASAGMRQWLLGVQVGLAVVLAAGALLFGGTLHRLATDPSGFTPEKLVVAFIDAQRADIPKADRARVYATIASRLAALPGVESAAASYVSPLSGGAFQSKLTVQDGSTKIPSHSYVNIVTSGFFRAYGTKVLEGRPIGAGDSAGAPHVAMVNRTFVRSVLQDGSIWDKRILVEAGESMKLNAEIIGIVEDAKYRDLRAPVPPTVYLAMAQDPTPPHFLSVAVRSKGPISDVFPGIRATLEQSGHKLGYILRTFESQVADSLVGERAIAGVSGLFGLLAVLLAGVGVYGLAAYSVAQRRTEIGIRMALGATAAGVLRLLFTQTGKSVLTGALAGAVCAAWAARLTESLLYGVSPASVWVYAAATGALLAVAAAAIAGPSLRATRLDPAETLRSE